MRFKTILDKLGQIPFHQAEKDILAFISELAKTWTEVSKKPFAGDEAMPLMIEAMPFLSPEQHKYCQEKLELLRQWVEIHSGPGEASYYITLAAMTLSAKQKATNANVNVDVNDEGAVDRVTVESLCLDALHCDTLVEQYTAKKSITKSPDKKKQSKKEVMLTIALMNGEERAIAESEALNEVERRQNDKEYDDNVPLTREHEKNLEADQIELQRENFLKSIYNTFNDYSLQMAAYISRKVQKYSAELYEKYFKDIESKDGDRSALLLDATKKFVDDFNNKKDEGVVKLVSGNNKLQRVISNFSNTTEVKECVSDKKTPATKRIERFSVMALDGKHDLKPVGSAKLDKVGEGIVAKVIKIIHDIKWYFSSAYNTAMAFQNSFALFKQKAAGVTKRIRDAEAQKENEPPAKRQRVG